MFLYESLREEHLMLNMNRSSCLESLTVFNCYVSFTFVTQKMTQRQHTSWTGYVR